MEQAKLLIVMTVVMMTVCAAAAVVGWQWGMYAAGMMMGG